MKIKTKDVVTMGLRFCEGALRRPLYEWLGEGWRMPPHLVDARITLRCNLRCRQCPEWKMRGAEELPTQTWKKIVADLRDFLGPFFLRFYGGEPFLRPDLPELVSYCSEKGVYVLITTNATLLDAPVVDELARGSVRLVNVSLDGLQASSHDGTRGVPGTHGKAMRAIDLLRGKIPVQINTTIMETNIGEILSLEALAREKGCTISFQGLLNIGNEESPLGLNLQRHPLFPQGRAQEIDRLFDRLIERKKAHGAIMNSFAHLQVLRSYYLGADDRPKRPCGALRNNHLMIQENGLAHVCSYFRQPIGNLAFSSMRELWRSEGRKRSMGAMRSCAFDHCRILRGYCPEGIAETFEKAKRYIFS